MDYSGYILYKSVDEPTLRRLPASTDHDEGVRVCRLLGNPAGCPLYHMLCSSSNEIGADGIEYADVLLSP